MNDTKALTEEEVRLLAKDWYHKLDIHAPMMELLPMLADKDLKMIFPEATLDGLTGFEGWYQGVTRIFFDEVHTVKSVDAEIGPGQADVKVVVRWEASRWLPPAARSDRIVLDAFQTWGVKRSEDTGLPVIVSYIVDALEYCEGSARL
ncbi:MAG: hypothetical protein KZQ95_07450 [Candidatus Thiodiazotropha sp. (ex Epidulcina cf. delphinae)]|nr:hypothetical protein [Candidatus Thiodiazotropha sp. (ex Epidulcina cf. delphinae)]